MVNSINDRSVITKELLDILACPVCKFDVEENNGKIECNKCKRKFPIKDGIPIMLEENSSI